MSIKVKEAVEVDHVPGCKRNKGCGPDCKRRRAKGVFEAHIIVHQAGAKPARYRYRIPKEFSGTRSEREAWADKIQQGILKDLAANPLPKQVVPTMEQFKQEFLDYGTANRQKASTAAGWEVNLRVHLLPHLGKKKLDEIDEVDVQGIKTRMSEYAPKSVNNVLCTLSKMLKVAKRLKRIRAIPIDSVELLAPKSKAPAFYDFEEFARVEEAAAKVDPRCLAMVYLVAHAGLRPGEVAALLQTDIYWSTGAHGEILVDKQTWREVTDSTKTNVVRRLPMTPELAGSLQAIRHLGDPHVLLRDDGRPANQKVLRKWFQKVQRRAGLEVTGNLYVLRHTFGSHLAMKGAGPKDIQELLGHTTLNMTMRYIHLTTAHKEQAVALLSRRELDKKASKNGARMAPAGTPGSSPEMPAG
ncbi:MAG: site-specific integrase [Deltaproteobacteria bacterium]|nr:site-specific integrase [Deltaproteobacteria bacterium]